MAAVTWGVVSGNRARRAGTKIGVKKRIVLQRVAPKTGEYTQLLAKTRLAGRRRRSQAAQLDLAMPAGPIIPYGSVSPAPTARMPGRAAWQILTLKHSG